MSELVDIDRDRYKVGIRGTTAPDARKNYVITIPAYAVKAMGIDENTVLTFKAVKDGDDYVLTYRL